MLATSKELLKLVYDTPFLSSSSSSQRSDTTAFNATFTHEERNLLSIAYRNIVQSLRKSFRNILMNADTAKKEFEEGKKSVDAKMKVLNEYKLYLARLLISTCNDCLDTLKFLAKKETYPEAYVCYKKMEGDYNRYLAEILLSSTPRSEDDDYNGDKDNVDDNDDMVKIVGSLNTRKIINAAGNTCSSSYPSAYPSNIMYTHVHPCMYVYDADANYKIALETAEKNLPSWSSTRLGMYLYLSIHVCMYVCMYLYMSMCIYLFFVFFIHYVHICSISTHV